jgi:hypothetical protein
MGKGILISAQLFVLIRKLLLASSFFELVVASCSRREFAKDRKSFIRFLLMSFILNNLFII